jgi:hypothetical protein
LRTAFYFGFVKINRSGQFKRKEDKSTIKKLKKKYAQATKPAVQPQKDQPRRNSAAKNLAKPPAKDFSEFMDFFEKMITFLHSMGIIQLKGNYVSILLQSVSKCISQGAGNNFVADYQRPAV